MYAFKVQRLLCPLASCNKQTNSMKFWWCCWGDKKHRHALPSTEDRPDASFFLLVPLCCPLLEQPADNQQNLIEQNQSNGWF